jgi:uncharacterized Rmd1/YagE family protein
MPTLDFGGKQTIAVRALYIGERIRSQPLKNKDCLSPLPLTISAGEQGCAVLQRYGVVVVFDLSLPEEEKLLKFLQPHVTKAFAKPEFEEVQIQLDESLPEKAKLDGTVVLHDFTIERLQTVANILAKSVVLAHYETQLAQVFEQIEPVANSIQRRGSSRQSGRDLLHHIGGTLLIQQRMVGLVEVEEKPEMLWECPQLEPLYLRLEDEYEIQERHRALERKLDLISTTATTVLELMQHQSSFRVEIYILSLIVVETLIVAYEAIF